MLEVPDVLAPPLARLARGRAASEKLFGTHWRDWVRKSVRAICRAAGVKDIAAHGMRGTHATLATERGTIGHAVAMALGHESSTTTYRSYATRSPVTAATRRKLIEVPDVSESNAENVGNDSN